MLISKTNYTTILRQDLEPFYWEYQKWSIEIPSSHQDIAFVTGTYDDINNAAKAAICGFEFDAINIQLVECEVLEQVSRIMKFIAINSTYISYILLFWYSQYYDREKNIAYDNEFWHQQFQSSVFLSL